MFPNHSIPSQSVPEKKHCSFWALPLLPRPLNSRFRFAFGNVLSEIGSEFLAGRSALIKGAFVCGRTGAVSGCEWAPLQYVSPQGQSVVPSYRFFYSAAKIAREECYFLQFSQIREFWSRRMSSIAHVAVDVVDVKGRRWSILILFFNRQSIQNLNFFSRGALLTWASSIKEVKLCFLRLHQKLLHLGSSSTIILKE